jgi:hypothetical protein
MFDFENAGAAPVEAAAARYLTLAEFTRVSAQQTHLRNGRGGAFPTLAR